MFLHGRNVVPQPNSEHAGHVLLSATVTYEVYGPFGQGYNIRTSGTGGSATLAYHWRDGPGADVKAPSGRYEMSDESAYDSQGNKCIQLQNGEVITELFDDLVLAIFVVNHYFATKTGPFTRANASR